jgi:23S rRNA (adenine2030-N6)-methyltransferase
MNYRHVYHAGNFADVFKHAVLALVIERLKLKEAAFRVIDTHAGIGVYDLGSEAAQKTGEWRGGIGRLIGPGAEPFPPAVAKLLEPYLNAVRRFNPAFDQAGEIVRYPGSPKLARELLRPQDRMVVNELHPEDVRTLQGAFARDGQVKVTELDGWIALKAQLPPKERRGVVLIDPPFEEPGEFGRLVRALREAEKRFATGVHILWYPIKDRRPLEKFKRDLRETGIAKLVSAEVWIRSGADADVLNGTGLVIHNPPFEIDRQLGVLGPFLAQRLGLEKGARWALEGLSGGS